MARKSATSSTLGNDSTDLPPHRSLGQQPASATRRTPANQSGRPRRGSTTRTTSSGTNSVSCTSQLESTSDGAGTSIIRRSTSLVLSSAVEIALGSPPRPVSATSDNDTGLVRRTLRSAPTSAPNREIGHSRQPITPPEGRRQAASALRYPTTLW